MIASKAKTRREAVHFHLSSYNTGKMCIKGHVSDRYTASGACMDCSRVVNAERYASKLDKIVDKRAAKAQLTDVRIRCFEVDATKLTDSVVAVTIARFPALDASDVIGKGQPGDRQSGSALFRFMVVAEDIPLFREIAAVMVAERTKGTGAAIRDAILGKVVALATEDNQAGEWKFK